MAAGVTFHLRGLAQTEMLARKLAACLRPGDCLLLEGPVGAGKSSFARAVIRQLCGADTEVPSPTFSLVQTYECGGLTLVHADLFRLPAGTAIAELGLDAALAGSITLVEWPEAWLAAFPDRRLVIRLLPDDSDEALRHVTLLASGPWPLLADLGAPADG